MLQKRTDSVSDYRQALGCDITSGRKLSQRVGREPQPSSGVKVNIIELRVLAVYQVLKISRQPIGWDSDAILCKSSFRVCSVRIEYISGFPEITQLFLRQRVVRKPVSQAVVG